jgi:hypothetical protein
MKLRSEKNGPKPIGRPGSWTFKREMSQQGCQCPESAKQPAQVPVNWRECKPACRRPVKRQYGPGASKWSGARQRIGVNNFLIG